MLKNKIYLCSRVIILFFVGACIHHVNNVVYCNGGLSNVRSEHNLPLAHRGTLEHGLLVSNR